MTTTVTPYGKYVLLKRLALGGMGEVFVARHRSNATRRVVVKRILPHHAASKPFVEMFLSEARVTAQLTHPHIVRMFEMGELEDSVYLAMEFIYGKCLRDLIDRARRLGEPIPPGHVADIVAKLCDALAYAHAARDERGEPLSIIHRDINPQNLLVSYTGDVKLIDFGIAKSELASHKTERGTIKGKFVYMSPEQTAAKPLDKRSDLFSVGICLYETLALSNPFVKSNFVMSMDAIQRLEPPPISQHHRKLAAFEPVLARMLAKDPAARFADAREARDALRGLLASGAVETPRESLADYLAESFEDQHASEEAELLALEAAMAELPPADEPVRGWSKPLASLDFDSTPIAPAPVTTSPELPTIDNAEIATVTETTRTTYLTPAETRLSARFYVCLALIVIVTGGASWWVHDATLAQRRAEAAPAPTATPAAKTPAPADTGGVVPLKREITIRPQAPEEANPKSDGSR